MREIKKPERRKNPEGLDRPIDWGYNQAYDLWEKYHNWKMSQLPSRGK